MNLTEVKRRAGDLGIDVTSLKRLKKAEIIQSIQSAEGHTPCYGSRSDGCPHMLCCFMSDCYKDALKSNGAGKSTRVSRMPN